MKLLVIPAAVAVAGLAAGCGGSSGTDKAVGRPSASSAPTAPASAASAVAAAYQRTTAAHSARFSVKVTASGMTALSNFGGTGAVDFAHGRSVFHLKLASLGTLETRLVGGKVYEKLPTTLADRLPGRKPWLVIDPSTLPNGKLGSLGSVLGSDSSTTPGQGLAWLRGVSGTVHTVGTSTVHGAPATEYRLTASLSKAAAKLPAAQAKAVRRAVTSIGVDTVPVRVWIDKQGRVVRMSETIAPTTGAAAGHTTTVVADYSDFGVPVQVSAPPAGQTTDLSRLLANVPATAGKA